MQDKDTSFLFAQSGQVNNLTQIEQEAGYVPNTPANADDVNFKMQDLDRLMNSMWNEWKTAFAAAGISFDEFQNDQILQTIINVTQGQEVFSKGYIDGGVPSWVNGQEISYTAMKARSDDDAANISGPVFNKTTQSPFTIGSGNGGLIKAGVDQSWRIEASDYLQALNVSVEDNSPEGIFFNPNGFGMYTVGDQNNNVYQYTLSTAWDISTAVFVQAFSVAAQGTAPFDITLKPDGTEMYIINDGGNDLDQYTLGVAWDISSAVSVATFDLGAQEADCRGIDISPDGTKLYTAGDAGNGIDEWDFGVAWDVTTLVHNQFKGTPEDTAPTSCRVKPDGTAIFMLGNQTDRVYKYLMSTPWDISTMTIDQSFQVAAQDAVMNGLYIRDDGLDWYTVGDANDSAYQYTMDTINNLSLFPFGIFNTTTLAYDVAYDADVNGGNIFADAGVISGGFNAKRRIGAFITNGAGMIDNFISVEKSGGGVKVSYSARKTEASGALTIAWGLFNLNVPSIYDGMEVILSTAVNGSDAATGVISLADYHMNEVDANDYQGQNNRPVESKVCYLVNALGQIKFRGQSLGGGTATLYTNGYTDERKI